MKRNEKKVPGFDEIIFENRNREYGAYTLRKNYKTAASFSIIGAIGLCALVFILLSAFAPKEVNVERGTMITVILAPDNTIDLNKLIPPELPKPLLATVKPRYVEPKIVEDTLAIGNTLITTDMATDSIKDGNLSDTINRVVILVNPDPDPGDNDEPFIKVEEDPVFPGGEAALQKYIALNTKYPSEASDNNIQGKVIVKFAVWSDGSIKRIEVLRSVDPFLDEEAVRVVSTLPEWKPGKQNGKPVPVWYTVPVTFQLINH